MKKPGATTRRNGTVRCAIYTRKSSEQGLEQAFQFAADAARSLRGRHRFTRLVRLSYLVPDITQAILDGRQPRDLTAEKLLEHSRLPLAWHDQRTVLGFG
jgi:hypothetical protein